jgi:hypothetical protein
MGYSKYFWGFGSSVVLLAALVPGCGGSSSAGPIPIDQLPSQLADAVCNNIGSCCNAAAIAFDLATCKRNVMTTTSQSLLEEDSPNIKYDAEAAGRCIALYASFFKSCKEPEGTEIEAACGDVFVGSLPAGAPCTSSDECAHPANSGVECTMDGPAGQTAQSLCVVSSFTASVHGKLGGACNGNCSTGDDCSSTGPASGTGTGPTPPVLASCYADDGLQCDFTSQTCQPLIAIGQPCSFEGCVAGAYCAASVCAPFKADGAPCADAIECSSGTCSFPNDPNAAQNPTCGSSGVANAQTCMGNLD